MGTKPHEKPHASADECLLLIQLKRKNARAAMNVIITTFSEMPKNLPDVLAVLDYLTNMVYCVELMLKLLADSWNDHDVAKLYEAVFAIPHPNSTLMKEIERALKSQKYLFEPNSGLLVNIADMEALYTELITRIREDRKRFSVAKSAPMPKEFLLYIRHNFQRFYRKEGPSTRDGSISPDAMAAFQQIVERELTALPVNLERWLQSEQAHSFYHGQTSMLDWS
jgi:hypothetical protein